jgi:RNA 3'-terminal phosphate cyclase-like protein
MVICPEDVCKVRFGELTDQSVRTLRLLRDAFGTVFKIKESSSSDDNNNDKSTLLSCLGIGYKNMARRIT